MKQTPVVLVHGAWFHLSSWEQWAERFTGRGFAVHVLGWPGEAESAPEGRRHPEPSRNLELAALIAHHEAFVRALDSPPILIGHGLGGLLVQHLFSLGLGRAAVALSPMPDSARQDDSRSGLTAPDPAEGFLALTPEFFRQAFANAVGEDEAARLFEQHVVPTPVRLLADLGFGAQPGTGPDAGTRTGQIVVDTVTSARGPLLFISGQEDHVIPDAVTRAAYKAYGDSAAVTDLKQFADRGHTLVVDSGWRTVADHVLGWLAANGIEATEATVRTPNRPRSGSKHPAARPAS